MYFCLVTFHKVNVSVDLSFRSRTRMLQSHPVSPQSTHRCLHLSPVTIMILLNSWISFMHVWIFYPYEYTVCILELFIQHYSYYSFILWIVATYWFLLTYSIPFNQFSKVYYCTIFHCNYHSVTTNNFVWWSFLLSIHLEIVLLT